jgi:hypothetical protein
MTVADKRQLGIVLNRVAAAAGDARHLIVTGYA